jgi:hypothetical protein
MESATPIVTNYSEANKMMPMLVMFRPPVLAKESIKEEPDEIKIEEEEEENNSAMEDDWHAVQRSSGPASYHSSADEGSESAISRR